MTEPLNLDALRAANSRRRALKEAATQGPWEWDAEADNIPGVFEGIDPDSGFSGCAVFTTTSNVEFVCAVRSDPVEEQVDALIAEVERLKGKIESAAAEERDACARIAELLAPSDPTDSRFQGAQEASDRITAAIRARSK